MPSDDEIIPEDVSRPDADAMVRVTEEESPPDPNIGRSIGRYLIKSVIASGGMGIVYLAEQERPRRSVALKLMKRGVASRSALRRFEFEAELLGRLSHPGIARIYEAGIHDDGEVVQFFAMEYIPGAVPLTEYADANKLDTRQRLELLAKVADAVHHGHQKGIIHRDLKPGNILVDSSGEPKVIDFGVARATDSDLAVTTHQTDVGQLIGTLQYMSPEQCEADPHDLDIRSDVYSLGIVMYETLCERLPYDVRSTRFRAGSGAALHEAVQVIQREAPVRPGSFNRALRGDIETIILKALEKDRSRRYQSAADLSRDIHHYLRNEPVIARPPSILYQLRKFTRRHRAPLAVASCVLAVLPLVTAAWLVQERSLKRMAVDEATKAKEMTGFLQDMLAAADPWSNIMGRDVKVVDVLDGAAADLETRFDDRPAIKASLHATIGWTYKGLGWPDKGEPHLERALRLREAINAPPAELAKSLHELAAVKGDLAQYEQAAELYRRALTMRQELVSRARGDPNAQLAVAETTSHLATCLDRMESREEAERLYREALHIRDLLPEDHRDGLTMWGSGMCWVFVRNNLATCLRSQGKFDEAEGYFREVIHDLQPNAPSPPLAAAMGNLAKCLAKTGEMNEAQTLLSSAVAMKREVLGPDDRSLAISLHDLGDLHLQRGAAAEAEPLLREARRIRRARFTDQHGRTAHTASLLGDCLLQLDHLDEAVVLLTRSYPILDAEYGSADERTRRALQQLIDVCERLERPAEAERYRMLQVGATG